MFCETSDGRDVAGGVGGLTCSITSRINRRVAASLCVIATDRVVLLKLGRLNVSHCIACSQLDLNIVIITLNSDIVAGGEAPTDSQSELSPIDERQAVDLIGSAGAK